jgi:hypothetical protein
MTTAADLVAQHPHPPFEGRAPFYRWVKQILVEAGYEPVKAVFDEAGNCTVCGECGRCPGWHLKEELLSVDNT